MTNNFYLKIYAAEKSRSDLTFPKCRDLEGGLEQKKTLNFSKV